MALSRMTCDRARANVALALRTVPLSMDVAGMAQKRRRTGPPPRSGTSGRISSSTGVSGVHSGRPSLSQLPAGRDARARRGT